MISIALWLIGLYITVNLVILVGYGVLAFFGLFIGDGVTETEPKKPSKPMSNRMKYTIAIIWGLFVFTAYYLDGIS